MRIEPVSSYTYQPYVYKPSAIDSNSLSRVKPIGNDLLESKTDFTGLTEEDRKSRETTNPLHRGETVNFTNVVDRQMQMGRMNASRLIKPAEQDETQEISRKAKQSEQFRQSQSNASLYQMQRAADAYQMFMTA